MKTIITIETKVNAPGNTVWDLYTTPFHVLHWNNASPDWLTSHAVNELHENGKFNYRMEARDGSFGFDFSGSYREVVPHQKISYALDDQRTAEVLFIERGDQTLVKVAFEAEMQNSVELQQQGWQAILNNFKNYVENPNRMDALRFEIEIAAPVEKVFEGMLNPEGYKAWTKLFNETSHYRGKWEKGAKILFIGSENGKEGGMVSRIREFIPHQFVSIEHYGILNEGREITTGPEVEKWAGGLENYSFEATGDQTHVKVDIDCANDFIEYFQKTYPQALEALKQYTESQP
ncbi:MAG: SRPBCC domain-containing protein [Prolixibacteraceae bacterium]|nr:SRPBCC domain-containing protein [Prolixibacteraceae bacterium]